MPGTGLRLRKGSFLVLGRSAVSVGDAVVLGAFSMSVEMEQLLTGFVACSSIVLRGYKVSGIKKSSRISNAAKRMALNQLIQDALTTFKKPPTR